MIAIDRDLDTQQTTCTAWASDRAEAGIEPEIRAEPFRTLRTALAEADRFDAYGSGCAAPSHATRTRSADAGCARAGSGDVRTGSGRSGR